jgi:WD40 repeat protein
VKHQPDRTFDRVDFSAVFDPNDLGKTMYLQAIIFWIAASFLPNPLAGLLGKDWNSDGSYPRAVFSPDDKYLAYTCGASGQTVALWDLAHGKFVRKFYDEKDRIESLSFSPDGKLLAASNDVESWLWDVKSGMRIRKIEGRCCVFSPDGKTILTGDNRTGFVSGPSRDGRFYLHQWETATGKNLRSIRMPNAVCRIAFSGDGQHVAVYVIPDGIRIWDVKQGKEIRKLPDPKHFCYSMAFSANGGQFALTDGGEICVWDMTTGKKSRHWKNDEYVYPVVFSPDGQCLAWGGHIGDIHLRRIDGDQTPWVLGANQIYVQALAFSTDGKFIAAGTEKAIHLFETASGQEVLILTGLAPWFTRNETQLTSEKLATAWQDLAGANAANAYRAIWTLAAAAPQSVPFLKQNLRPAEPLNRVRLAQFIKDLSSDSFQVRTQASRELETLGASHEFAVRKALSENSSLEFKRRAELILSTMPGPIRNPDLLRKLRALKVLEHIGSENARKVIEVMARGEPEALVTQAAQASLGRLRKFMRQ